MKKHLNSFIFILIIFILFVFGVGIFFYDEKNSDTIYMNYSSTNGITKQAYNGNHILEMDSAGSTVAILMDADGSVDNGGEEVWVWGSNEYGQFGNGTKPTEKINTGIPIKVDTNTMLSNPNHHIIDIEVGGTFVAVLVDTNNSPEDGEEIWAWGDNKYGQLGNNKTINSYVPTKTYTSEMLDNSNDEILQISLGNEHIGALVSNDGNFMNGGEEIWSWGKNNYGQLGIGSYSNGPHKSPIKTNTSQILDGNAEHFNTISYAYDSSGLLLEMDDNIYNGGEPSGYWGHSENDANAWLWGNNNNTQLSWNKSNADSKDFYFGGGSYSTLPEGMWINNASQKGNILSQDLEDIGSFHVSSLEIGQYNSSYILTGPTNDSSIENVVEIAGANNKNHLQGNDIDPEPGAAAMFSENPDNKDSYVMWNYNEVIKSISPSNYTVALVSTDGNKNNGGEEIWTIGSDEYGQQGNGIETKDEWDPTFIDVSSFGPSAKHILDITTADSSIIALIDTNNNWSDGGEEIWTWGNNNNGQLGNGNIGGNSIIPVELFWPNFSIDNSSFTILKNEWDELIFSIEIITLESGFKPELITLQSNGENLDTTFIGQISGDDTHGEYAFSVSNLELGKGYFNLSISYDSLNSIHIDGGFVVPIGGISSFSVFNETKNSFTFNVTLKSSFNNLDNYINPEEDIKLFSGSEQLNISFVEIVSTYDEIEDTTLYSYTFKATKLESNTTYSNFVIYVTYHYLGNDIVTVYEAPNANNTSIKTSINIASFVLWTIFVLGLLVTILVLVILFL